MPRNRNAMMHEAAGHGLGADEEDAHVEDEGRMDGAGHD